MSLIRLQKVTLRYDDRPVLREVFFRLQAGDRVGLIGKNGTGKTSILRLILGREQPTEGTVEVEPNCRIGYFSQFSELDDDASIQQILEDVFADVRAMEQELADLETRFADLDADMDALLARQAELIDIMVERDGWSYPTTIDTVLGKLGFSETYRHRPLRQLSGGWRNRAALAKILLEEPDVLLLDEPTNFLDIEGVAWLEHWLQNFRGAVLVVSHDRQFLDRVVRKIVEIENFHLHPYEGNWSDYIREKQFRFKTLERQFEHEEALLVYEAEAIRDRAEAAKAGSAGLKRKLADIKKRTSPRPADQIITVIYDQLHVTDTLLRVENLGKSYGAQRLFDNVSFEVHREERLAIIGPNGCGKSTLLRVLTEQEPADTGKIFRERRVELADFNQILAELDPKDTVTHAVNITGLAYAAQRKQVNRFLELLQFSEMDQQQKIGTLSGGQRARVALAKCLLSGASILVLDEPTNHLDTTSIQVMERALLHFPGAIITVSHDRFFLDKVATQCLAFDGEGGVEEKQISFSA